MVRFIIASAIFNYKEVVKFTFQYGQIYYQPIDTIVNDKKKIYIPIWLDLLCLKEAYKNYAKTRFTFQYGQIYY